MQATFSFNFRDVYILVENWVYNSEFWSDTLIKQFDNGINITLTNTNSEFSETPNQAYFYANFWFCTRTFPAGDSNLRQVFFCWRASQTP